MKVLVIGSGGREHALVWKLAQSAAVREIATTPGNPGTARFGPTFPATQPYLTVAREYGADLTIVGPEAPLVDGIVDSFRAAGLRIVGPTSAAAQLEGSKAFSKAFMKRAGIPTAESITAESAEEAAPQLDRFGYPLVLKADGLAAGKGVVIAQNGAEALEALRTLPEGRILIEEYLRGEEVSFIVYGNGTDVVALEATQDHKAIHDGDVGPNTGGMGAYCDGRILNSGQASQIMDQIIHPTLDRMKAEGTPYTGFLYAGLMMTGDGPKVLEFNARLGDPETQPMMHRMDSDLLEVLLDGYPAHWKPNPSVCVVLAAAGYPGQARTGDLIRGLDAQGATIFHAGTRKTEDGIVTSGGRVLGVTASGADLGAAISNAYSAIEQIQFEGMQYRRDIGRKGLKRW